MSETQRTPSAFHIERSLSVWHALRERLDSDPEWINEETIREAYEYAEARRPEELLARLIDAVWWNARRIEEAEALRKEMQARRARFERRDDLLRALILDLMGVMETRSERGRLARATISVPTKQHVVITDAEALPDEYVRVTREPNRSLIAENMIKHGEVIAGAELSNAGAPVLTIRTL